MYVRNGSNKDACHFLSPESSYHLLLVAELQFRIYLMHFAKSKYHVFLTKPMLDKTYALLAEVI